MPRQQLVQSGGGVVSDAAEHVASQTRTPEGTGIIPVEPSAPAAALLH